MKQKDIRDALFWVLVGGLLFLIFWLVKKDNLIYIIQQSLPPKEAGLMAGILLGDKAGFEKSFYESLKNSGLVHLVVVSGSNVMLLIGGLIEKTATYLGRKRAIIVGLAIGWWYVTLVGWEVPVLRAMLLLTILYYAQLLGRRYNLVRGLILAILIMVVGEIGVLGSISFWLSILAFVSIVVYPKLFKIKNNLTNALWQTIWVSLWISPILAMVFGKVSLISPITNMMVLGAVEVLTVIGALGLILGKVVFWLGIPLLKYLIWVVEIGGSVAGLEIRFNWWMLIGYYLILLYFLLKNKVRFDN